MKEPEAAYDSLLRQLHILEEKVYKDSLTGVFNRRLYDELLFLPEHTAPALETIGFVMADVSKFKQLNDTYGHLTGDYCLCEIARVLSVPIRENEFVIRYGGDEFLLILKKRTRSEIVALMNRLKQNICEIRIPDCPGLHINVNMGYALADIESGERTFFAALLRKADERMYREKKGSTF